MEQVAADANPPVAQLQPNAAASGAAQYALTDDLLAGRFFSIDVRGQVTGWNPRAEAAFGWSTHHVSGVSLFEKLLVSGLGFSPRDLEDFFAAASGGAGRRVRVLINHQAGSQLPVELSIVPIQLAKAYELNAFLQDVSTSTASGVASEIGRVRAEHASVLDMISGSLEQEPDSAPDAEVRLAGALVVFHIDASAMTMAPPRGGATSDPGLGAPVAGGPPVGTAVAEDSGVARAEAERVRAQIDEALAAAEESRAAAEEARCDAERLRGELDGLRAAADGSQASAESNAADLGQTRAELSQAQGESSRLAERLEQVEAELGAAREERDSLRREVEALRAQVDAAGETEAALAEARSQASALEADLAAARGQVEAAAQRAEEIAADAAAAREGGEAAEAAVATAREEAHAAQAELAEARVRVEALEAEVAEAREEGDAAQGEVAEAREQAAAAQAEVAEAREQATAAQGATQEAHAELKSATEDLAAIRAELEAVQAQAESAGRAVGDAQTELGEARSDAVKARAEAAEARAAADAALAEPADPVFETIFDGAAIGIAIKEDSRFVRVNRALCELTGRDAADLLAIDPVDLVHPDERDAHAATEASLTSGEATSSNAEARLIHATGEEVTVRESASVLEDGKLLFQFELTETEPHVAVEDHDPVTGLFNRRRFEEELSRHVAEAAKHGDRGAALMLDLDANTSELDDAQGEELLKTVAEALKQNIDESEMLAHLGGDEFAVLLPHADAAHARKIAAHIVEAVGPQVVKVGDHAVRVTIDVGVALFDEREEAAGEAPQAAEAPPSGDNLPAPLARSGASTALAPADGVVARIRRALAEDTFSLYAQPIIDLRTSEITQYELLLRLHDDSGRLMLPDKFLPAAQDAGLMPAIDQWVVCRAIGLIAEAAAEGRRLLLEVNISSDSIDDPALTELIEAELDATGIDPRMLVIEVTEDAALNKIGDTIKLSKWIRSVGCRFALDDFGSTFATVKYLKDMPVDYFKLDGDLIVSLPESRTNQLLLNALMDVARGTGTQTIAVYVPDDETLVMLRQFGIGYGQGNRVGRPRPVGEI